MHFKSKGSRSYWSLHDP